MKYIHASLALTLTLGATLALGACNRQRQDGSAAMPSTSRTTMQQPQGALSQTSTPTPSVAPVTVVSVDLGNAIDPSTHKIAAPSGTFAPNDTIYASVNTTGSAARVELAATWTDENGHVLNKSSTTIAPTGPVATAFHIANPSGLQAGNYKVAISLNGAVVATKDFTVQ